MNFTLRTGGVKDRFKSISGHIALSDEKCVHCGHEFEESWSLDGGPSAAWRPFTDYKCPKCELHWDFSREQEEQEKEILELMGPDGDIEDYFAAALDLCMYKHAIGRKAEEE